MSKAIVIGSGISGLSVSNLLKTNFNVKILEKADLTGGLVKCTRPNGTLFHLVGGHVFNSKNQAVLDWFWKHFDKSTEFLSAKRNAKILIGDQIIDYPIENYISHLPKTQLNKIIAELTAIQNDDKDARLSDNFEDFLKNSFGQTLFDIYFGPYNKKIWNTSLKNIPLPWLNGKLPMPRISEILQNVANKKSETGMVHSTFYYPINNGSQFIVDRLAKGLDIDLSYAVKAISHENDSLYINDGEHKSDIIVWTGDVRQLANVIKINDTDLQYALNAVKDLPSNATSNVLCETDDSDISWLYLPDEKYKAHRIIYTGNFSETNNGTERKTCVVEFSGQFDQAEIDEELKLLPGNLKPIAYNYEPCSYIIHQKDTAELISNLKSRLALYNIYLLGRFAEWEYYNMDACIESAMRLEKFILDKTQPSYNAL